MKVAKIAIYILLIIYFTNITVYAAGPNYSLGGYLLKLIIYMALVLFVVGLAILGTKLFAKGSQKFIKSKYMKIVDILSVGTNVKLLMVEIGEYIYVIVITNSTAELIEKIKKDELIKNKDFNDELTKYTLNYINIDKIKKILGRDDKFDSEEDGKWRQKLKF